MKKYLTNFLQVWFQRKEFKIFTSFKISLQSLKRLMKIQRILFMENTRSSYKSFRHVILTRMMIISGDTISRKIDSKLTKNWLIKEIIFDGRIANELKNQKIRNKMRQMNLKQWNQRDFNLQSITEILLFRLFWNTRHRIFLMVKLLKN